jgi:2-dehydro-3-deoxygluconokinase
MKQVCCFGELLLRLSPELNGQWIKQRAMPVFIGGAELNVATALALWGIPVSYCTALPDNYLAKEIITAVSEKGIDTGKTFFSGNKIGSYYLPQGADLKNTGVIYDRAYSSFWDLQPGQIDWDKVLDHVSWFHFSAISPALNKNVAAVCKEALESAFKKGLTISVDLNYRAKLWQYGKQPADVMPELLQYCNIIMGNLWAAEKMLGIPIVNSSLAHKEGYIEQSLKTSEQVARQFPQCRQVANTFRFDKGEGIEYFATLYDAAKLYVSGEFHTPVITDKIGTGDAFMAGLIYGDVRKLAPQQVIDFAAAAAFSKLFIKGDATTASVEAIKKSRSDYA